jgi:hypothetical protein
VIETVPEAAAADADPRAWIYRSRERLSDVLPAETLALLYRIGIPIRFLSVRAQYEFTPLQSSGEALRSAAGASEHLGRSLGDWQ